MIFSGNTSEYKFSIQKEVAWLFLQKYKYPFTPVALNYLKDSLYLEKDSDFYNVSFSLGTFSVLFLKDIIGYFCYHDIQFFSFMGTLSLIHIPSYLFNIIHLQIFEGISNVIQDKTTNLGCGPKLQICFDLVSMSLAIINFSIVD